MDFLLSTNERVDEMGVNSIQENSCLWSRIAHFDVIKRMGTIWVFFHTAFSLYNDIILIVSLSSVQTIIKVKP
jgi:hypothetical protein